MPNIAVVGCGAIGITSALALQRRIKNAAITIFTKDVSPNTTSDIAGGLWEPYLPGNTPEEDVFKWAKRTYDYLTQLWHEGDAMEAGISLQAVTYLTDDVPFKPPNWLKGTLGYSILTTEQLEQFKHLYKEEFSGGFYFTTFIWEASIFIPYLTQKFLANGGRILKKPINDLSELSEYDLIVNCTGLGSKELLGDACMKPIRGQVSRVKAPWQFQVRVFDSKTEKFFCIIPNIHSVILGGTRQENNDTRVDTLDKENILKKCSSQVPSILSAAVIKDSVGLRPGRESIRVESEIKEIDGKRLRIVHNYGHGGSGITLSVGCAISVAELAEKILQSEIKCKL